MSEQSPDIYKNVGPAKDSDSKQAEKGHQDFTGNNAEEGSGEHQVVESSWLDPRRILELKERFNKKMEQLALINQKLNKGLERDEEKLGHLVAKQDVQQSEHLKTLIKTSVIENAIRKQRDRAEWLAGEGPTGTSRKASFETFRTAALEVPTEEVKAQMAAMMERSDEELQQMANMVEEKPNIQDFKDGQKVNLIINGQRDEGWQVVNPGRKFGVKGTETYVGVAKKTGRGTDERYIRLSELREQQEQADNFEIKSTLEAIKPYFGKKVKVKVGDEVVEGRNLAASFKHNGKKVYVDYDLLRQDDEGRQVLETHRQELIDLQEFLDTQKEKTTAEKGAERIALEEAATEQPSEERREEQPEEQSETDTEEFTAGATEPDTTEAEEDEDDLQEDLGVTEEELRAPRKRLARLMAAGDRALISFGDKIEKGALWPMVVGANWWWAKNVPKNEADKIRKQRRLRTHLVLGTVAAANYFWHEPYGFR